MLTSSTSASSTCSSFFHGWVVVALCLLVRLLKSPGQSNVLGVSVPVLLEDMSISTTEFAGLYAAASGLAAIPQPLAGRLFDATGARICIPLGLLLMAASVYLLSVCSGREALFLSLFVLRVTAVGCLEAWPIAAVSIWYSSKRGRVLALLQVCSGAPVGLVAAAIQASNDAYGWRVTHSCIALLLGLFAGLCALLLHNRPEDVNQLPDGVAASASGVGDSTPAQKEALERQTDVHPTTAKAKGSSPMRASFSASRGNIAALNSLTTEDGPAQPPKPPILSRQSTRCVIDASSTPQATLAILCTTSAIGSYITGGCDIFTLQAALARGATYDVTAAVIMPVGVLSSVTTVLTGTLLDWGYSPQYLLAAAMAIAAAAAPLFMTLGHVAGGIAFAVTRGAFAGILGPAASYAVPYLLGTKSIGFSLGALFSAFVLGTCLGALAFGNATDEVLWLSAAPPVAMCVLLTRLRATSDSDNTELV